MAVINCICADVATLACKDNRLNVGRINANVVQIRYDDSTKNLLSHKLPTIKLMTEKLLSQPS